MIKHKYKGWTICKGGEGYIAERDSDCHIAPETYRLLSHAKESIDNGKANLTCKELKIKENNLIFEVFQSSDYNRFQ